MAPGTPRGHRDFVPQIPSDGGYGWRALRSSSTIDVRIRRARTVVDEIGATRDELAAALRAQPARIHDPTP